MYISSFTKEDLETAKKLSESLLNKASKDYIKTMGPQFDILTYYKNYYEKLFVLPEVTEDTILNIPFNEPDVPGLEKKVIKKNIQYGNNEDEKFDEDNNDIEMEN